VLILCRSVASAAFLLSQLEAAALPFGMTINRSKTQFMVVGKADSSGSIPGVELVTSLPYLGATLFPCTDSQATLAQLRLNLGKAWAALSALRAAWRSVALSDADKCSLFVTTVAPILTYGSESWVLSPSVVRMASGQFTRMVRITRGRRWDEFLRLEELYGTIPPLPVALWSHQLLFLFRTLTHVGSPAHLVLSRYIPEPRARSLLGQITARCGEDWFLAPQDGKHWDRLWKTTITSVQREWSGME
jgi:hypothetical protein